jgi:hypothetical protein
MKLNIPTAVAVVLALVGGVLQVLNQTSFHFAASWHELIVFGLLVITGIGISPLVGPSFRNALHLTLAATTTITVIVMVLAAAVQTLSLDASLKGIINGILTVLAGLGFGAATGSAGVPQSPAAVR